VPSPNIRSPYFCQMRWTVAGGDPFLARRQAFQWVSSLGLRRYGADYCLVLAELICRGRRARALVHTPPSVALR
jgi:hypothetical protein